MVGTWNISRTNHKKNTDVCQLVVDRDSTAPARQPTLPLPTPQLVKRGVSRANAQRSSVVLGGHQGRRALVTAESWEQSLASERVAVGRGGPRAGAGTCGRAAAHPLLPGPFSFRPVLFYQSGLSPAGTKRTASKTHAVVL